MRDTTDLHPIHSVGLGDIVRLPDGRELTVRACERQLSVPVGSMAGWLLAGEIGPQATLLSLPTTSDGPVLVFTPLEEIPRHARAARAVVEGVVSYWAPHLPNVSGAMGELGYRVCTVRASAEPMVLLWRGRELVVFVQSATTSVQALTLWALRRAPEETERDVARHASRVAPTRLPNPVEAPPVREPVRTGRR